MKILPQRLTRMRDWYIETYLLPGDYYEAMKFGCPLAGKSSLCRELGKYARFRHIGVGDCIHANVKYAREIQKHLALGELIPDGMCFEILREALNGWHGEDIIYLIDGFPRSQNSLEIWRENGMPNPLFVLHLYTNMRKLY